VLEALLDWLAAQPPLLATLVLAALSALENVFPPVPADVAVALGAFLSQRGEASALVIGVSCWLANTASAAATYFLARHRGPAFFASAWGRKIMPPWALDALRDAYRRHGILGIFLSRFLPGIRAGVTPFAGVVGMGPTAALVPAAAASGLWYAAIVVVGSQLGLHWEEVKATLGRANHALAVLAVLAALAAGVWLWRRRRRHIT
jgi:membrane protein DedA with SNARE-associated domain